MRIQEHFQPFFLSYASRVQNRFQRAALNCPILSSSLFISILGISYAVSSARSGPPCPSITQKTDTFQFILAQPVQSSIKYCQPQVRAVTQFKSVNFQACVSTCYCAVDRITPIIQNYQSQIQEQLQSYRFKKKRMAYVSADSIYPKRLGIINGNTLVIEYYNLAKDKFKKHAIPFNSTSDPKSIVEDIFKNPKHLLYLKKVDPKNVRAVIEGQSVFSKKAEARVPKKKDQDYSSFRQDSLNQTFSQKRAFQQQISAFQQQQSSRPSISSIAPAKQIKIVEQNPKKIEEVQQQYAQEFQDFQISQSIEKGNSISANRDNSHEPSQISNKSQSSEPSGAQLSKPAKKKEQPIIQQVIQQETNFEFIEEDVKDKKGKKEKKQKKDKKEKSKSKDSKSKKQKQAKTQKVIVKEPAKEVQEEFQFL